MKILNGWREIAKALGVSIPTARKVVKRDRPIRGVVEFNGSHPCVTLKELKAAVNGRVLVMRRGRKNKLY